MLILCFGMGMDRVVVGEGWSEVTLVEELVPEGLLRLPPLDPEDELVTEWEGMDDNVDPEGRESEDVVDVSERVEPVSVERDVDVVVLCVSVVCALDCEEDSGEVAVFVGDVASVVVDIDEGEVVEEGLGGVLPDDPRQLSSSLLCTV